MRYERVKGATDEQEAAFLFHLGYRQISNKFGIVARIDVPDLVAALKEKLPFSSVEKWERWLQEDYWRRCYSQDKLEGVDPNIMRYLRKMSDYRQKTTGMEMVAICEDNTGIEEQFDKGIEYLVSRLEGPMIYVLDKFGQIRECMAERFNMLTQVIRKKT